MAESDQRSEEYRYSEARQIIPIVRQLRAAQPDQTIAVLARKRAPLTAIAESLREAGVAFEAVELENLDQQNVVQDLISLCGILLQPMDTLAWLAVLRAPWCGLSLHDLTVLRHDQREIYPSLVSDRLPTGLSEEGTTLLSRLCANLLPLVRLRQRLGLGERLRRAWLRLRGSACYDAHELVHVEPFFELLGKLESGPEPIDRERLLQACADHSSSSPASSLKLMTIHKAKGLEFDHVIVTGLAARPGGNNRRPPLMVNFEYRETHLLAPPDLAGATEPGKATYIRQQRKSIEAEEAARLLYVAVTRAQRQLYLFATLKLTQAGTPGKPEAGSLLNLLWQSLENDFTQPYNQCRVAGSEQPRSPDITGARGVARTYLPPNLESLNLPPAIEHRSEPAPPAEQTVEFSWAQEDARVIGLVIHRMLEFADLVRVKSWENDADPEAIAASLGDLGLPAGRIGNATRRTLKILRNLSLDPRAHWLFDPEHRQTRSEWALSSVHNGEISRQVIDRSFIDAAGILWIVDFKTGSHEGGDMARFLDDEEQRYADQLNRYAELVRHLEPDREIRLGLYFPALGQWRERRYQD